MPATRTWKLVGIGMAAGAYSGLFGVGGGSVIVPALIVWLAYGERQATGTSLLAVAMIAALGATLQGTLGHARLDYGLLIGVPAVGGVLAGVWIQQRVPGRWLSLAFAGLLVLVAADLVLG